MRLNQTTKCTWAILSSLVAMPLMWSSMAMASRIIPVNTLPRTVVNSINASYRGAVYLKAEYEVDYSKVSYEVTICHKGNKLEIELTPEGKFIDIDYEGPC